MSFYMGLGMDLLASTFDVESVVFLRRGSHFMAFYGGSIWAWGMDLLVSTFDVESVLFFMHSVVFFRRGSHFLC